MGYFSDGSEGDMYRAQYCARYVHGDAEISCPVMGLHMLYNYGQGSDDTAKRALTLLIPEDRHGNNLQCAMFYPAPAGARLEGF